MTRKSPITIWITLTLFSCFLPFIEFGSINLYVSEVLIYLFIPCLLMTTFKMHVDLFVAFSILFLIGCLHAFSHQDPMHIIIPARNFVLFYLMYILTYRLSAHKISVLFNSAVTLLCVVYTLYVFQTVYFMVIGKYTLLNFLYDYELGRIKAFFENGTTSVVIGSLLSILFTIVLCSNVGKYRVLLLIILFCLGFLTASRANILSNIVALFIYHSMTKPTLSVIWLIKTFIIFTVVLTGLYLIMLKVILVGVSIDGSALTRLQFYMIAAESAQSGFDFLLGHGFTEKALQNKFGISFFESYFVNSYMQAGFLGLTVSSYLIVRIVLIYDLTRRDSYTILSGILIANLVGGANFFSIFVLPFLLLGLRAATVQREKRGT